MNTRNIKAANGIGPGSTPGARKLAEQRELAKASAEHALAAALQNMMDAYGQHMDAETLREGRKALAAHRGAR